MSDFVGPAARARPDALAVEDGRRRWSYAVLHDRVGRMARVLASWGAGPGTRVALDLDLSMESVAALHASFRTGALVAPLNPRLTEPERVDALGGLAPGVVVSDRPAPSGPVPVRPLDELVAESDRRPSAGAFPHRDPGRAAAVLWTSGTSGRPRGVLLSEAGLRASAEGSRTRLGLRSDDVWYAALSTAHVGGLALVTRAALLGSGLAVRGPFDVDVLDALLDEGAVTHASLVPTMLLRLLEVRHGRPGPEGLRCLLVGGAHAPVALVERAVAAGYPVALTYGLTEATSQVATAPPDEVRRDPSSVGRPLPGVEVRIAEGGEILVRGPTVAAGLLGGGPLTDADGWFATGDRGSIDADGRLRVVGRRSDRIVTGGTTVDAHEVEAALREHPAVADACVVGLADETWGERVGAAVVPNPDGVLDASALMEWLRPRLSAPKRPRDLRLVDRLPLNPNGKVDRAAVRGLLVRS